MPRIPKYRKHSTNRGFVEFKGHRHYLPGEYDSAESRAAYQGFIDEKIHGKVVQGDVAEVTEVGDLIERFLVHAQEYFPGVDGEPSSRYVWLRIVCRKLAAFADDVPIADFGPKMLKRMQSRLAEDGLLPNSTPNCRTTINQVIGSVVHIFKWGVSEELCPSSVYESLRTVASLRAGRTSAREPEPRTGVGWEQVEPVIEAAPTNIATMLTLQWFTGARSRSICLATRSQFDTSQEVWFWRPRHKTELKHGEVILPIGPRCQEVLSPYMERRSGDEIIFSPRDSRKNSRYTDRYTSTTYYHGVARVQKRIGVERWSPHQLRHARAQIVRESFSIEHAQAVLGHANLSATQIYTHRDLNLALEVARRMG